jgi:regulator of RNase E activity RraA
MRDSGAIKALDFPTYHQRPAAPLSLIRHHAADLNVPIGCAGVAVYPGDVMVGDDDGVVVIPAYLANTVAHDAYEQTSYEDFVAERVDAGDSIFGLYPATEASREAFASWLGERNPKA